MDNRVGQQLGNYRLIQRLGVGGFAEVYLGEHVHLKTQRAVKVLHTVLEDDTTEGFLQEARIVASLNHPHIVRVLDYEVDNHTPFLVMDYYSEGNMRRLYPKSTQLPLPTIVFYIKQFASALQYAHDKKIIHRDIKPENMLLDQHHTIAISDFGIAFMSQSSHYHTTQAIAGTAAYMAPEQLQGHPQRASDQYATGIVVYEWLAGDLPFHGSFTEIASQHLFMPPPRLSEKVPSLPSAIEQVVLRALEKDPRRRFEDVQAFATALEQASLQPSLDANAFAWQPMPEPTRISPLKPTIASLQVGASDTMHAAGQKSVPASNATTFPVASPYATTASPGATQQPGKHLSRRTVIASVGGVAGLGMGALALHWVASNTPRKVSNVPTPRTTRGTSSTTNGGTSATKSYTSSTPKEGTLLVDYPSTQGIWAMAWSPNGKYIASSGEDPAVHIWDATTGKEVFTYTGHVGKGTYPFVATLAWSPDGSRIVSASSISDQNGSRPDIQVWEVATQKLITTYTGHAPSPGHTNTVAEVAWSPDSTRIVSAGAYDGTTQIWDAKTGNTIFTYRGQSPDSIWKAGWSPNGQYIASASNGSIVGGMFSPNNPTGNIQVWHTNGQHVFTYNAFPYGEGDLAWSPNSKFIASINTEESVQIWEAATGIPRITIAGFSPLAWSHNGKYIAVTDLTSPSDTRSIIHIFDTSTDKVVYTFHAKPTQINIIAWSPDDTRIASCSATGNNAVLIWRVV
jgi:eukaryotic-like serine/threonine-protein kinase